MVVVVVGVRSYEQLVYIIWWIKNYTKKMRGEV